MEKLTESDIARIYRMLNLEKEMDRLRTLIQMGSSLNTSPELPSKEYYTIRVSTNSKVETFEDEGNAELEGSLG